MRCHCFSHASSIRRDHRFLAQPCANGIFHVAFLLAAFIIPSVSAGAVTIPATDSRLASRFWREYPSAVRRLEAAAEHLRGKARYRVPVRGAEEWVDVEFLTNGPRARMTQRFSPEVVSKSTVAMATAPEVVLLWTPRLNARVNNPNTPRAWADDISLMENTASTIRRGLYFDRYIKAAYCVDGVCLLNEIEAKRIQVLAVSPASEQPQWVRIDYTFNDSNPKPEERSHGRGVLLLSPDEDWAIRQLTITVEPPFNFRMTSIVEVQPLGSAPGFVVKHLSTNVYNESGQPIPEETCNYQLHSCQYDPAIPEDEFSLAAVGVQHPVEQRLRDGANSSVSWWPLVLFIGIVVVLGFVFIIRARYAGA